MKTILYFRLVALAASLASAASAAETAPTATTRTASATDSTPPPTPPTTAASTRFSTFENASTATQTAVSNAQSTATTIRNGSVQGATVQIQPSLTTPLATAVKTATAAIVQEGRVARPDILAERQAALTRLRLAQTEQERRRLVEDLRTQAGQRMEEQREIARLVRDRLRELRDTTTITPRPGS